MERIIARTLGNEGQGIGNLISGKVFFAEGLLPGEEAEAEVISEKQKILIAEVKERLNDSDQRVIPPCRNFGICGGCDLMHMSEELELSFKKDKVKDALRRIGGIDTEVRDIIDSPRRYNYRNHMQYVISGTDIGLRSKKSSDFSCADGCLIEYEAFTRIKEVIRKCLSDHPTTLFSSLILRGSERTSEYLAEFVTEEDRSHEILIRDAKAYAEGMDLFAKMEEASGGKLTGIVLQICSDKTAKRTRSGKRVTLYGVDYYREKLCGRLFRIRSGAFFQVNTEGAEQLYGLVREVVKDAQVIYDLFCGTGSIGLCCASEDTRLFGIEVSPEAVSSAKINAGLNGIRNATFVIKQAERFDFGKGDLPKPDAVIVDPPRKGMDIALITKLRKLAPEKIIYVSCDPATLARDLKNLSCDYEIISATPVNMFPFSHHVETVVLLSKGNISSQNVRVEFSLEDMDMSRFQQGATYEQIQEWVQEKYGFHVTHLNIAQVKRKHGIIERENYNKPKSPDSKQPGCPEEKTRAIEEALRYYQMI